MLPRLVSLRVPTPYHLGLGKIKGQYSSDLRNRLGMGSVDAAWALNLPTWQISVIRVSRGGGRRIKGSKPETGRSL